jgi:hypothetical protein
MCSGRRWRFSDQNSDPKERHLHVRFTKEDGCRGSDLAQMICRVGGSAQSLTIIGKVISLVKSDFGYTEAVLN